MLKELCEALTELHALGIVHRDVKPDNLLQTPDDQIYLLDLDAARQYKNHVEKDTCMLGTAGFAAPEQFGIVQTDHRADLFALGVTLNVLVTGSHPSQILCRGPLRRIIVKCTRIDPKTRYQTARAVWRAAAPIYHLTRLSGIFLSRRKRYLAGLCTCAALLCAACVFLIRDSLYETLPTAPECGNSSALFSSSQSLSAVSHITDSSDSSEDNSSSDTIFSFVSKLFGSSAHEPISASSMQMWDLMPVHLLQNLPPINLHQGRCPVLLARDRLHQNRLPVHIRLHQRRLPVHIRLHQRRLPVLLQDQTGR